MKLFTLGYTMLKMATVSFNLEVQENSNQELTQLLPQSITFFKCFELPLFSHLVFSLITV